MSCPLWPTRSLEAPLKTRAKTDLNMQTKWTEWDTWSSDYTIEIATAVLWAVILRCRFITISCMTFPIAYCNLNTNNWALADIPSKPALLGGVFFYVVNKTIRWRIVLRHRFRALQLRLNCFSAKTELNMQTKWTKWDTWSSDYAIEISTAVLWAVIYFAVS